MRNLNTALAAAASLFVAGSAFAQPAHTEAQDFSNLLENIYQTIDETQSRNELLVIAKADSRMNLRMASINRLPAHRPLVNTFAVAHLAP